MKDDLFSLYDYQLWADRRVLDSVRALDETAYTRELGGGWPSIRATLVHLAGATHAWAERLEGRDATVLPTVGELPAFADAERLLTASDARLVAFLGTVGPERLDAPFAWRNLKGQERVVPLWALLRHVVNHGSYHRGQLSAMVKRVGGTPAATDLVLWAIERSAAVPPA